MWLSVKTPFVTPPHAKMIYTVIGIYLVKTRKLTCFLLVNKNMSISQRYGEFPTILTFQHEVGGAVVHSLSNKQARH